MCKWVKSEGLNYPLLIFKEGWPDQNLNYIHKSVLGTGWWISDFGFIFPQITQIFAD
jgi:hypothetical protein